MKTAAQTFTRQLRFLKISPENFADIAHFMSLSDSLTCDYTFGGIALWADYFDYSFAILDNTLYISGRREDDRSVRAFAMPVGNAPFQEQVQTLRTCVGSALWFSAVPEDRLHLFAAEPSAEVIPLGPEWSDYLYDIRSMASLKGGRMKKKRNHMNRFLADSPGARLADLTSDFIPDCLDLLQSVGSDFSPTGVAEYEVVSALLTRWDEYAPFFHGSVLLLGEKRRVVGFTVGEIKGKTLHVHVEKCNHSISGANEALTAMFAAEMLRRRPGLLYANRQDDAGDPGLRASKLSWRPMRLLPKFNLRIP